LVSQAEFWWRAMQSQGTSKTFNVAAEQKVRALWKGEVLAESSATIIVEGNHYFPISDVRLELLRPSSTHTTCHWKGVASYYDVVIGDQVNTDAAWYYPDPKKAAERVTDRIAFWHGVSVVVWSGDPQAV
jgi:uncharacterized protein (DUF427 family)